MEGQLHELVAPALSQFANITKDSLQTVLSAQAQLLGSKFDAEKAQMQTNIAENQAEIERLRAELERTKTKRLRSNHWAFVMFNRVNDGKVNRVIFDAWLADTKWQRRKKRMTQVVLKVYKQRAERRVLTAWRKLTHIAFKAGSSRLHQNKLRHEVLDASQTAHAEIARLQQITSDLSQDLRNEVQAKEHLQFQYEQALLRGLAAVNMQNLTSYQTVMHRSKAFTETSKSLLFTPQK